MRKFFTLLTMCLLATSAWAVDIVFNAEVDKGNAGETAAPYSVPKDGVVIDVTNGLVGQDKGVWAYRVYKGQIMTISCETSDITKIVIECTANGTEKYGPGCFTVEPETYTYDQNIGTWTGQARKVTFNASANQVRATKITVTIGQAGLAKPVISPAAGTYYDPINVTMTCSTSGAKIYYTTNGSNPTTNSTQYTAPFKLSSNATVKAISAMNNEVSDVVEASYEFATAVQVKNIREYQQVEDGTVVKFVNPVTVTAQSGQRMFVMDATGYALFYGNTGHTYTEGDIIPAGFVGTKITYGGEPELTDPTNFQAASGSTTVKPRVITANQIGKDLFGQYVIVNEAEFDLDNMLITDASGEGPIYFNMNVKKADVESGVEYNVTAVIGSYGTDNVVYQLMPVKVKRTDEPDPDNTGLGELERISDKTNVRITHNATVLWSVGSTTYAKDETGYGLIYGNIGSFAIGDIIDAPYTGQKTTYNGKPELQSPSGIQPASQYVNVDAEVKTIPQLGESMWAHYVRINQVTITTSGDNGTITDAAGNTFPIFTKTFGFVPPADGQKHDLWAIVASYKPKNGDMVIQLLPISVDEKPERPKPIDVASLQELYQLNKISDWGHFTTPLTVVCHKHVKDDQYDLYIMDAEGEFGLVFGKLSNTYVNGDQINGAIAAWTTYNDNKQLTPNVTTFVVSGHGTPVEPQRVPIEEISQDMVHNYFAFDNVSIISREENDRTNYYLIDENGDEMLLYNRYNIELKEWNDCNLEAFMTVYPDKTLGKIMELYPIEIIYNGEETPYPKGDVNGDGEVSLADVNALINIILGADADEATKKRADVNEDHETSVADINALINIILS